VFEERINILLSTLLDPKCTYADFEIFDFETKAALIKEFPVVVAKKAQELVARKYSPPKDAEQTTKKLALDDLANALTAPTDQKAGGATKTLEASVAELAIKMRGAINTATTPITEKPNFSLIFGNYRSSDTGNFFIAVVKATEFLTRELMSLKNHRLCELLGKEVAVTAPAPAAASAAPAQPPTL
jgi:hypothetical protein